ncbi:MAG: flagellar protein FlgN [Hyphomicrobiales bacterium]|nr:MAG: flagellar protein FlgN [Hyphomicrobiales bacterium]
MIPHPVSVQTADVLVATPEDARALCADMAATMDALIDAIEQETALIRAGKLFAANDMHPSKSELAERYLADVEKMRQNSLALGRFAPAQVDALRRRHEEFRALLQINLAVLATARQVSQDLVHSVARKLGAKGQPQNYGSNGSMAPSGPMARGISLDGTF